MYRALIVDDEPFILEGMDNVIEWEEFGIEIAAKASNGVEAMELLGKMHIDILITDIKMPEMNGLELINNLRQRGMNTKIIVLSGFDDFRFVKEASRLGIENYLLKPIEEQELSDTLLNVVTKLDRELHLKIQMRQDYNLLKENILFRWVTNSISDSEFKDRAEFLDIRLDRTYYMAGIVRLLPHVKNGRGDQKVDGLVSFACQNICMEILKDAGENLTFITMNGDVTVLFCWNNDEFDSSRAFTFLGKCIESIREYLKKDVFVTIGSVECGYQAVHLSYNKAVSLFEYQLVMQANSIAEYERLQSSTTESRWLRKTDFEPFKNSLAAGNKMQAERFIDEIFLKLSGVNALKPEYVRSLTFEILFHISGSFHDQSISDIYRSSMADEVLSSILHSCDLKEIAAWLKVYMNKRLEENDLLQQDVNPFICSLLQYINNNYAREMSLKTLSARYKTNAAYLGQLFKNTTGEMFSNYLNRIRIEKAKELLANTNMKTGDISAAVGYSNVNYFSNLFNKMTGVYPTEYKKSHT